MTQAPAVGAEDRRMTDDEIIESIGGYEYGWHDSDDYSKDVPTGINEKLSVSFRMLRMSRSGCGSVA